MASSASMPRNTLTVLTSVLVAPAMLAYAHLTKQSPAANAEIAASPQTSTLNFSKGVEPGFNGATLAGPNREQIKTDRAPRNEQDKTQPIVPLDQTLEAGKCTVNWHAVSVDGHRTKGQYIFSTK